MAKIKIPAEWPKIGRPTAYSKEWAQRFCELLSISAKGLQRLCDEHDWLPKDESSILEWVIKYPEFAVMYTSAKQLQADLLIMSNVDRAFDTIPDRNEVMRTKFINDEVYRIAEKLLPRKYGVKQEVTHNVRQDEWVDKLEGD